MTDGTFTDNSTPQNTLFGGDVVANFGTVSFTLTGLSTFSSYDVYVYYFAGTSFSGNRKATVSASGSSTTYYVSNPGGTGIFTSFTRATQTTDPMTGSGDYPEATKGNYVEFEGLTNATQTISYSFVSNPTGVVGFQVVGTSVPEPASLGLLGLGGMTLLARQRKIA